MIRIKVKNSHCVRFRSLHWSCLCLLLLIGFALPALAEEQSFYQAAVAVKSQSAYARKAAAVEAFAKVILRVSGTEGALANDAVKRAQSNAISYVEQFQYHPLLDPKQRQQGYTEILNLNFSAPAIERLLRTEARQPFWPISRPETLVWLVEDTQAGKQFVSEDIAPDILAGFQSVADERGLPLSYPLLDLHDQVNLAAEQVWILDEAAILAASKRYKADVILVGRFSKTSRGEYLGTWQFFHRGDTQVYDSRVDDVFALGRSALNPLADYLGHRYAILPSEENTPALVLQLTGVKSFGLYRKALDYLENIAAVSDILVSGVRQDTLLLEVESDADVEKFINVLTLDGRIKKQDAELAGSLPVWQQVPMGTLENPLRYRWDP